MPTKYEANARDDKFGKIVEAWSKTLLCHIICGVVKVGETMKSRSTPPTASDNWGLHTEIYTETTGSGTVVQTLLGDCLAHPQVEHFKHPL